MVTDQKIEPSQGGRRRKYIGFGLIFGVCLGAAGGSLLGNIGAGMCLGFGLAFFAGRKAGK